MLPKDKPVLAELTEDEEDALDSKLADEVMDRVERGEEQIVASDEAFKILGWDK
jgi:predicted DNA-binding protein